MNAIHTVWLASFPRSGNTLLRTILWQCFGFRSGSLYLDDLDGNQSLADYIGHIERDADQQLIFPPRSIPFVKTHELDTDDSPAIYVIRDGRAVAVSLAKFYGDRFSLDDIIAGKCHKFCTWAAHLRSWQPWERPATLLLRYEDMLDDLPSVLAAISRFLNCEIIRDRLPDRDAIAAVDGKIVRPKSDWRTAFSDRHREQFERVNQEMLRKAGYRV